MNEMDRKDKAKRLKDGGTVLKQIQVQRTVISKKIRWIEGDKSYSQYLVAGFLDVVCSLACGLISRNVLKLF